MFASNPEKINEAANRPDEELTDPVEEDRESPVVHNPIEVPELTENQNSDLNNPRQDDAFRRLPKDEQITLLRAHRNLGHPSPERLSTILRQQGFRAEVARAALQLRCSVLESSQPKGNRPSTLRDDMDFNDRITVDGFKWTNSKGKNFRVYHIVDWATSFHAASIAPSRSSEEAINTIINAWFSWAAAPGEMLIDAGIELNSEEFSSFVQRHNIRLTTISSEAHFQNGRSERHGAVLQNMLSRFDKEHPIETGPQITCAHQKRSLAPQINCVHLNKQPFRSFESLACSNSILSLVLRVESLTSALCFFAAETKNIISSGFASCFHF